jgi:prepilin-type N-terminal cleavage/methylation domain-containing protein
MNRLIANLKVGFTLIELMIVVAVFTVTLVMAVPAYSNYLIRAKIGEAFTMITAVESATAYVCQKERSNSILTNQRVGYKFKASDYVQNIVVSGTCDAPTIMVTTRATGAQPSPVLTITGNFNDDADEITWTCVSSGLNSHTPRPCRS